LRAEAGSTTVSYSGAPTTRSRSGVFERSREDSKRLVSSPCAGASHRSYAITRSRWSAQSQIALPVVRNKTPEWRSMDLLPLLEEGEIEAGLVTLPARGAGVTAHQFTRSPTRSVHEIHVPNTRGPSEPPPSLTAQRSRASLKTSGGYCRNPGGFLAAGPIPQDLCRFRSASGHSIPFEEGTFSVAVQTGQAWRLAPARPAWWAVALREAARHWDVAP
jgi:hypothetical protein